MRLLQRPMPRWPLTGRSTFLLFFGLAYALLGFSLLITPPQLRPPTVATNLAPIDFWGGLWMFCGILAIVTGCLRWIKWVGFGALMFIGLLWTIVSFSDWLAHNSPRGWVGGVVFACISVAVYTVAGMIDGPRKARR
jgi:hypothetical protein